MTILCPKCTGKVDSYYRFCPKCGQPQAENVEKPASELAKAKKPLLPMIFIFVGIAGILTFLIMMAGSMTGVGMVGEQGSANRLGDGNDAARNIRLIVIILSSLGVLLIGVALFMASSKKRIKELRIQAQKDGFAASTETAGFHFCNKCGADLPSGASYCVSCGRLAPEMPT